MINLKDLPAGTRCILQVINESGMTPVSIVLHHIARKAVVFTVPDSNVFAELSAGDMRCAISWVSPNKVLFTAPAVALFVPQPFAGQIGCSLDTVLSSKPSRRKEPRYAYSYMCEITYNNVYRTVKTLDISTSGVSFVSLEPISTETVICIDLYNVKLKATHKFYGTVRNCTKQEGVSDYRIGMEFNDKHPWVEGLVQYLADTMFD